MLVSRWDSNRGLRNHCPLLYHLSHNQFFFLLWRRRATVSICMLGSSRERDREKRQKEHLLTLSSLHTDEERRGKKDRKKVAQICSKVVKRFCDVTKKRQACLASTSDFFAADASLKRLAKKSPFSNTFSFFLLARKREKAELFKVLIE